MRTAAAAALALTVACAPGPPARPLVPLSPRPPSVAEIVRLRLACGEAPDLRSLYETRGFELLWVSDASAAPAAEQLVRLIATAAEDGLDPAAYGLDSAAALLGAVDPGSLATLELRLSELVARYGWELGCGRVDPGTVDSLWARSPCEAPAILRSGFESGTVLEALEAIRPPHAGYRALRAALARYREAGPTAGDTVRRIEVNLERWRWLPHDLGARHVVVNIASSEVAAVENACDALRTRAVVGRADWQTPMVSGQITGIVVNPSWQVPRSIAVREIVPQIRADTGFLRRERMLLFRGNQPVNPDSVRWDSVSVTDSTFPFRLVQLPGPRNPLGRLKLSFSNAFNVTLHDTPARALFNQPVRTASHGCVRLESAADLAGWLLGSRTAELTQALADTVERAIPLPQPVPVHLVYFTAWVDAAGDLHLAADPYGWDRELALALEGGRHE